MYAKQLETLLGFMFTQNLPVLVKGSPGIGKSDIVAQAAKSLGWELIISHPVVADPTDYKGLPFVVGGNAEFLPFGDLRKLLDTKTPLIYFLDDLGQATPAVQSAVMQLLLARQINGHKISPEVRFVAATNGRADKANVSGILEPVKSRFASIVELEVKTSDWIEWAWKNGMPHELTSFIEFKPDLLNQFKATRDIENSPSPRTVAFVGKMVNAGMPSGMEYEIIKGAAGEGFATEYLTFVKCYMELPTVSEILKDPKGARLPASIGAKYAITGALTDAAEPANMGFIITYLQRLGNELTVSALRSCALRKPAVSSTPSFINWAIKNSSLFV